MLTPAHVEEYCNICADNFRHGGYDLENAVIFRVDVERRLRGMPDIERQMLILRGMGFTRSEIALQTGLSLRTVTRRMQRAYSERATEMSKALNWIAA